MNFKVNDFKKIISSKQINKKRKNTVVAASKRYYRCGASLRMRSAIIFQKFCTRQLNRTEIKQKPSSFVDVSF